MSLYLAFDVGGTKTACALADEERELARVEGGSIKTLRIPGPQARANLESVLLQLVSTTGLDLRQVRRTCIGTSGIAAPEVRAWMQQAIAETVGSELVLLGDEVIALDAAFPGRRGVLVIAGTGSNIVGRAATGQMTHAGGWGPMLADEGSGHWIGQQALRACFRAIDAGPANAVDFRFAQLVPVVVAAAREGDPLASATLAGAGEALAMLVAQVIARVEGMEAGLSTRPVTPDVAYIGGVLTHIPAVRTAMHRAVEESYPGVRLLPEPADALAGALWHARGCP